MLDVHKVGVGVSMGEKLITKYIAPFITRRKHRRRQTELRDVDTAAKIICQAYANSSMLL